MPRTGARTGGDGRSEVPGLCSHPLAKSRTDGGVWGAWKGAGCWKGPEYCPGVTLDPSVGAAVVGGLQGWQKGAGCMTNIAPAQAALSSPSLPQIPGVSPHTWVGVRVAEGTKKEPEAAAAEPREPFYCTAKQGTSLSSVPRSREATPELSPTQQAGPQGRGEWGPGGRREPHDVPSAPLTGPAARARAGLSPRQPRLGGLGNRGHVPCQRSVSSSVGHSCSPWNTPAFTQPSRRAYSRS